MKTRIFLLAVGICILLGLASAATLSWLWRTTPGIEDLQKKERFAIPSVLLAADGTPLANFRGTWQKPVPLAEISPAVIDALVATEDHRFYQHHGVDFRRTAAALLFTLKGDDQGGSTITQQLARNLFPDKIGRSRSVQRKLKEMITAIKIERAYGKSHILEIYLNTVPFLYNVFGIEMAARTYFNKSAADLNVLESATLVGMLKGSSHYNPATNPERALSRRNVVLSQMVKYGELDAERFAQLSKEALGAGLYRPADPPNPAPHFVAHARRWLTEWADRYDIDLQADGLTIETTLDLSLQETAARAVERQTKKLQRIADAEWSQPSLRQRGSETIPEKRGEAFSYFWDSQPALVNEFIRESSEFKQARKRGASEADALNKLRANKAFMQRLRASKTRLEAGFIAMDPNSGEIKAWVGSRNFQQDQFDHVAQAARQPGSTFKPFVYGAALEQGIDPQHSYSGNPRTIRLVDGTRWRPTDMGGVRGQMTLREGLIYSKNVVTAQIMQDVGIGNVVRLAQSMGIKQSKLDPVISLSLGTSPVTLLELASAYSTIATVGDYVEPVFIKRITDRNGNVLAEFGDQPRRPVMSTWTAIELIDMLRAAVDRGTGQAIRKKFSISADVAGKTGTTQNNTDGWFVMMHPNLVAGAWVGFNDQRVTMRSDYWGQGGHNAILLVGDFFRESLKSKYINPEARFPKPWRVPLLLTDDESGQQTQEVAHADDDARPEYPPPGSGVIVRRDGGKTYIGDARGIDAMTRQDSHTASRSPEELGRIMSGMGRDPDSGVRMDGGFQSEGGEINGSAADPGPPSPPDMPNAFAGDSGRP